MPADSRFAPADVLDAAPQVLLYGAGRTGRKVLQAIRDAGGSVRAFLDAGASTPGEVDGVPVLRPFPAPLDAGTDGDAVPGPEPAPPDAGARGVPVVITVFNRDADTVAIAEALHRAGYGPIVSYPALHARHRDRLGDDFWLGDPARLEARRDVIARADSLLADDLSRDVFRALVALYRTRDPACAPVPDARDAEYLPPDLPGWPPSTPLRLVDGGAYDGDTLERFRAAGIPIEAAACFEPDPDNYRRLCNRVAGFDEPLRAAVSLFPFGIADRSATFAFDGGLGESSHLSASASGHAVRCVALDEALPDFRPNLIKLDVEGAEESALGGMQRLVAAHRPALALSVYHRPGDLWALLLQVDDWNLGYRFHLRSHGYNGFDTVCYAIAGR